MTKFQYFVGIDIASATFVACIGASPWKVIAKPKEFDNHEDGYASFLSWTESKVWRFWTPPSENNIAGKNLKGARGFACLKTVSAQGCKKTT